MTRSQLSKPPIDEWTEGALVRWLVTAQPERREEVLAALNPEWLFTGFAQTVLDAINATRRTGVKLDALELMRWLRESDKIGLVKSVTDLIPDDGDLDTGFTADTALEALRETAQQRKFHSLAALLLTGEQSPMAKAEIARKALAEIDVGPTSLFRHVGDSIMGAMKLMEEKDSKKIPTGLADFDRRIGGLTRGWLTVIGARPSIGKTAFALRLFRGAAEAAVPAAYLSYEMPTERLILRMVADLASIENQELQRGNVTQEEFVRASGVFGKIANEPMYFFPSTGTWPEQCAKIRAIKSAVPDLGLCVIDYLTLITGIPGPTERYLQLGRVTRDSIRLAQELDVAIVLISQLNRQSESGPEKRPTLTNLRESGNIEQDADMVILLWRPGVGESDDGSESHEIEIRVEKNRDGRRGKIAAYWDARYTRIADLANDRMGAVA